MASSTKPQIGLHNVPGIALSSEENRATVMGHI